LRREAARAPAGRFELLPRALARVLVAGALRRPADVVDRGRVGVRVAMGAA
jgi:hypothetical protein